MPVSDKRYNIKTYLLSCSVSIAICFFCLIASCAAVYLTEDPGALQRSASLAALYIASFASGVVSSRLHKGKITASLITGIVLSLTLSLISMCHFKRETDILTSVICHVLVIAVTVIGGLAGRKRTSRSKAFKRRMKRRR